MPVFRSDGQKRPDWCALEGYEIVHVHGHDRLTLPPRGARRRLVVTGGEGWIVTPAGREAARAGLVVEPPGETSMEAAEGNAVEAVWLWGDWHDPTGGCGVFHADETLAPINRGDPVGYEHRTTFDAHYHDCDEYWIIVAGRAVAVSEGKHYDIGPGDCVATGMGHHHNIPRVSEPIRAVYFETTLEGRMRRGHLWNHTHGPAEPRMDRV
jgi:mannose-6-phosphate isomerase-like protein (cupin superfamily)